MASAEGFGQGITLAGRFRGSPNSAIWLDSIIHCSHGFCNFSHTHQWQLLTGFCEETVGTTTTSLVCSFAARLMGSYRCTEIGQNISICSVDAVARTQPASFSNRGIPTLITAPLANNGPAKAEPMIVAVVQFNPLRFVLRQHYSSVARRKHACEKQRASRSHGRG